MIDSSGYRANIGIIIINQYNQLFWAKRIGQTGWQFPQGGVNLDETIEQALYRELEEEVGLKPSDVTVLEISDQWFRYKIPEKFIRKTKPTCIGQKQKWCLLRLEVPDSTIHLEKTIKPEFDAWRWVSYWYPLRYIISFKKVVYRRVLKRFAPIVLGGSTHNVDPRPLNLIDDDL